MNRVFVLVLFVLTAFYSGPALSQSAGAVSVSPEKDAEFKKALSDYLSGRYEVAALTFEGLSSAPYLHQRSTASYLMTGKSLYKLGKYTHSLNYLDKLLGGYPRSEYLDDAHFVKSNCYYRMEQFDRAAAELVEVLDNSADRNLVRKSVSLLRHIVRTHLSNDDIADMLRGAQDEFSRGMLILESAHKWIESGEPQKAASILEDYKRRHAGSEFSSSIDRMLEEARGYSDRPVKVGVILPLTGPNREFGLSILKGIKYGQRREASNSGSPVQIIVRDSESNLVKAIEAVNDLTQIDNVSAIIGELESSITAGIGAVASLRDVPVIGPTATENGVASVGNAVFQLNSNLERKGEALADYAFNQLGMRTFATLAPADEYGRQMASSFTARIDELGGRIIAQSWYYGQPADLQRQFKSIREAAFHYDSTDVEALIRAAEGRGDTMRETEVPVFSIDGFFLPVYTEDIAYVAPQYAQNNIRSHIFGGEYWYDLELLKSKQVGRYVEGAIFVSDYFANEDSRAFRDFRNGYRLEMKTTPDKWAVMGYDSYSIISRVIHDGARSGREITGKLKAIQHQEAIKGTISFSGNNRVNDDVNFLQFIGGRIIKHKLEN